MKDLAQYRADLAQVGGGTRCTDLTTQLVKAAVYRMDYARRHALRVLARAARDIIRGKKPAIYGPPERAIINETSLRRTRGSTIRVAGPMHAASEWRRENTVVVTGATHESVRISAHSSLHLLATVPIERRERFLRVHTRRLKDETCANPLTDGKTIHNASENPYADLVTGTWGTG